MTTRSPLVILFFFLATFSFFGSDYADSQSITMQYHILPQSQLYIEGCSNVKDFTCACNQTFPKSTMEIHQDPRQSTVYFKNTNISLLIRNLDCGHSKINRDMYATLKASQFPYISIQLSKAVLPKKWEANNQTTFQSQAIIKIAGKSQCETLSVNATKLSEKRYRFRSEKVLKMSDFSLSPPSALMGLIKVEDHITIYLDLYIEVE